MDAKIGTIHAKDIRPKVHVSIASTIAAYVLSQGVTYARLEAATGISGLDLADPDIRLPEDVVPKIWLALAETCPQAAQPIEMARAAPFSFFGGLAHGIQFADNLGAALDLVVRNRILLSDSVSLDLIEEATEARLIARHPQDAFDQGRTAELGIALVMRLIAEVLGVQDFLLRVEFSHAAHSTTDAYQSFFHVPVLFEQPQNMLVLHRESLTAPIHQANVDLFAFVNEHFDHVRRRIEKTQYPPELTRMRAAIVENASSGDYRAASAAARARMSLRSAQRLATTHGTSLKALIETVRAETAKELLSDLKIDIVTVATLLGYSDDRAFRRAFKNWTGQSPSEFRRNATKI